MGRIGAIFDFCYPLYQIVDEELSHLINWSNTEKFNNILFDTIRYMKGALQIKDLDNMSIIEIFDFMIKTQTLMEENHKKE